MVDAAGKPVGMLGRADLIRALKQRRSGRPRRRRHERRAADRGHRATLDEAFKLLQEKSAPAVGVVDAGGRLVGLVTGETIAEMLMLQEALPSGVRFGPWSRPAGSLTPATALPAAKWPRLLPALAHYIAAQQRRVAGHQDCRRAILLFFGMADFRLKSL